MSSGSDDELVGLDSLGSISEGAGLFVAGTGLRRAIEFATNLVLTRALGATLYGFYAYVVVLFSLFRVLARLGGDKSLLKYLPEYEDDPRMQRTVLTLAYGFSLAAATLIAVLVYVFAPLVSRYTLDDPLFVDVLRIAAFVIPFNTLANVTFSAFKGLERMDYNVVTSSIVQPVLRLCLVGGAVGLGYSLVGATAGFVVSGVLTLLFTVAILVRKTDLGVPSLPTKRTTKEYLDFSVPLTFNQLGNFLYSRADVLMVGFLLTGTAVGIYNVAILVSSALLLPLSAFGQLFPPIASRLYTNDDIEELAAVYRTVTRWTFTVVLFPAIAVFLYADEVLVVFGKGFSAGSAVLALFVVAQLTNSLVGPSGFLLMMTGHQYLTLFNQLSSGVVNVVLNYLLIVQFGLVGAALATASVLASINLLRVIEVWYIHGFTPYSRSFLKPLAAGIVAGVVMYAATFLLESYTLLVVGSGAGGLAFLTVLSLLGIEREEIELIRSVVS